ncbi:unnamed protein product [Pieris brassicae]|uniref:PiggyBac transposable element-derived protein domain-containing protein n=1 Tax=Pieris brassicae TaxID=7116 RepID=A0A9P0TNN0_PIEBR|nr:unnamed protein product [Pieris brassicae]
MIPYYGRHGCKQHIKGKPIRYGFKAWVGATRLGYVLWMEPYQGATTMCNTIYKELGLGASVVLTFCDVLISRGFDLPYHVVFDNFFTGTPLLEEITKKGLRCTGTVRENRTSSCPLITSKLLKKKERGAVDYRTTHDNTFIIAKWHDNNIFSIASYAMPYLNQKQIEEYLALINDGENSEDDLEDSDTEGNENFYENGDDLLHDLESPLEEENDDPDNDPFMAGDPPLINEATANDQVPQVPFPSTSQASRRATMRGLVWKVKKIVLNSDQTAFHGDTTYPPELKDEATTGTPYSIFSHFITSEIVQRIVEESNLYSVQKNVTKPLNLSETELRKFMAILIYMSVIKYPNVRLYWSNTVGFQPIKDIMTVNRFETIRRFLHFNNNEKHLPKEHPQHDRLHKIRPIISHLNEKFALVPMEQKLSIDEQMCATKVAHFMKQYLPNKPHKWGFKLYVMCSVKGYAHKFEIYTGQENERLPDEPDFGPVGNVVVRLARGVPRHINHIIYFDNFYTSVPLVTYLAKQGIYSLGTVQSNRLVNCKLPDKKTMMKKSVPRGTYDEQMTEFDGIDLTAVTWKDNKVVTFLSSYVGAEPVGQVESFDKANKTRIKISCPHIIKEYNAHMGGVDLMDSFIGRLELAEVLAKVNNSFELCNKRGRPSTSNSVEMEIQAKKRRGPAQHIPPKD